MAVTTTPVPPFAPASARGLPVSAGGLATGCGLAAPLADERAARRDLRDQIARLERELGKALVEAFPRREPPRSGRSASAQAGPRLLTLGQLEQIRDELAGRVESFRSNPGALRLEQMRLAPERHCWETVTSEDLGEPGCSVWQVRPRLGLIGMLMGWWQVKLSSGCPLATGHPRGR